MTNSIPLVSVICPTFNHEKFIAQTLDGFILQQTSFPFEVIVHDDASTDQTASIVKEYEARFPHIFNNIYQSENQLSQGIDRVTRITFLAAKGKYIALCEGDDYWIDALKLQKQVDFLEEYSEYSICIHGVYEQTGKKMKVSKKQSNEEKTFSIEDLAKGNIIHTPTVVFRNGLITAYPTWFSESPAGDYVLHMLNARKGLIKYFPQPMAVYRKHESSMWSSLNEAQSLKKWLTVLNLLSTEPFDPNVLIGLKQQKRETINRYLNQLITRNFSEFLTELKGWSKEEPEILEDWLYEYYPEYINSLTNSGSYKLARKISKMKSRLIPHKK